MRLTALLFLLVGLGLWLRRWKTDPDRTLSERWLRAQSLREGQGGVEGVSWRWPVLPR